MKNIFAILAAVAFAATASAANDAQAINDLIPRLADQVIGNRYAAEMELQALAADASKPGNEAQRAAFGTALAAKAADASVPQPARVWIVRQLQYMGGAEAVEALTGLLNGSDAELREVARRALEKNSAPAASASLRAALTKGGEAAWVTGLVNSLGERRDAASVSIITAKLPSSEAAWALGRISSPEAVTALWKAFPATPQAGDALICAANRLAAAGDAAGASAIFLKLYEQAKELSVRIAALAGAAKTAPAAASKLVAAALSGNESRLQDAAVAAAATSPEIAKQLSSLLPSLPAPAKAKALAAASADSLPAVLALAGDADSAVRVSAIEALGRIGTGDATAALLKIASMGEAADKAAAEQALVAARGASVASVLEKAAAGSDPKAKIAALNALAARQQSSALPLFLASAGSSDAALRKAGINGLRQVGGDAQIEAVAKLVVASGAEDLKAALSAMAERASDKAAATEKLLSAAGGKDEALAALAPALSALGSDKALEVFTKLSASHSAEVQQAAVEALGNWPSLVAATALTELASPKNLNEQLRSLAFAALVNMVKNAENATPDQRLVVAQAALNLVTGPADTKLALSALASVPSAKAGEDVKKLLADPAVQQEAASAALTIAEALARRDKATSRSLAEAVKAANISANFNNRAAKLLGK